MIDSSWWHISIASVPRFFRPFQWWRGPGIKSIQMCWLIEKSLAGWWFEPHPNLKNMSQLGWLEIPQYFWEKNGNQTTKQLVCWRTRTPFDANKKHGFHWWKKKLHRPPTASQLCLPCWARLCSTQGLPQEGLQSTFPQGAWLWAPGPTDEPLIPQTMTVKHYPKTMVY